MNLSEAFCNEHFPFLVSGLCEHSLPEAGSSAFLSALHGLFNILFYFIFKKRRWFFFPLSLFFFAGGGGLGNFELVCLARYPFE